MPALSKWIDARGDELALDVAQRAISQRIAAVCQCAAAAIRPLETDDVPVHDLRVAARRATAAIDIFRGCIRRKSAHRIRKPMRAILAKTKLARDLEMLAAGLMSYDIDCYTGIAYRAAADIEARRLKSREQLPISKPERDKLVALGERLLMSDAWLRESHREPLTPFARRVLASAASKFFDGDAKDVATAGGLQRLRTRCRRLRYTMEIVDGVFDKRLSSGPYQALQELHRRTGAVQDHAAAVRTISMLRQEAKVKGLPEFYALLLEEEEHQRSAALHEVSRWWTKKRQAKLKKQVQEVFRTATPPQQSPTRQRTGSWLRKIVPTRKVAGAIA